MNQQTFILLMAAAAFNIGCSDDNDKPRETVFQGQIDSLHKAQQVEKTLMDTDQRQRDAIEAQSD